jgi:ribosome recycling factor
LEEDVCKDAEDEIQKMTDSYAKKIDTIVEAKEKEVMTV